MNFLRWNWTAEGVVATNRDVLLEELLKDFKKYICDAGVLCEIQASNHYKRMERAVRDELNMEEDLSRLYKNAVHDLLRCLVATALFCFSCVGCVGFILCWNVLIFLCCATELNM
ncbi:retrotransposon hot spot (RHS) protein [Trypanosoma cruzi]|nr:retrotransposon hot spot (RHS) protein [Trypanosoma cruzi]